MHYLTTSFHWKVNKTHVQDVKLKCIHRRIVNRIEVSREQSHQSGNLVGTEVSPKRITIKKKQHGYSTKNRRRPRPFLYRRRGQAYSRTRLQDKGQCFGRVPHGR